MPLYFFDLADGSREPDLVGSELQDHAAAEIEGIRFLGEVLKHEPTRLAHGTLRVDVRDDAGGHPFEMAVTINRRRD